MSNPYWVIQEIETPATIVKEGNLILLTNGLIKRTINIDKNAVTTSYMNLSEDMELLCESSTEAIVGLDGRKYNIGGEHQDSFIYESHRIVEGTIADFSWEPKPYAAKVNPYPALGTTLEITYKAPNTIHDRYKHVKVILQYEIFQGIPVIAKRGFVRTNAEDEDITITYFASDQLHVKKKCTDQFYIETNYNGGSGLNKCRDLSFEWEGSLLTIRFDLGPNYTISNSNGSYGEFKGFKAYVLLHSAHYYEQRLIEVQKMYSTVAPWVLESPLTMHLVSDDPEVIKQSVDSIASVGFDMIMQSFGSSFNIESTNPEYIKRKKEDSDYAHSKGIDIGGYTLAVIKDYSPINDPNIATNADPDKISRCMSTDWAYGYYRNILKFMEETRSDCIEIDGAWHFYTCDAHQEEYPAHHHKGYEASRYQQWLDFSEGFLLDLKKLGAYVQAPDWMYLNGVNKVAIGYEEIGWSQPRQEQLILARQYNYRGTFLKMPSMGWGFIPIDEYHGGGYRATFEPLDVNSMDYEWAFAQALVSGVQPCFRGRRIYANDEQKKIISYWVQIYKRYIELINGHTIHVKYPEINPDNPQRTLGMDIVMQVNAKHTGTEKGLIMVFNQTDEARKERIHIPLYYTGLTNLEEIPMPVPKSSPADCPLPAFGSWAPPYSPVTNDIPSEYPKVTGMIGEVDLHQEGSVEPITVEVDSNGNAYVEVKLDAMSYTWYTITKHGALVEEPIAYPYDAREALLYIEESQKQAKREQYVKDIPVTAMTRDKLINIILEAQVHIKKDEHTIQTLTNLRNILYPAMQVLENKEATQESIGKNVALIRSRIDELVLKRHLS